MSAAINSPVLGLPILGPYPENDGLGDDDHLTTLYLTSPASQSESSGCIFATIAFLNPAFSKALFHPSIPLTTNGLISSGVDFSTQNTMGSTGSDSSAVGSFFTNLHLLIKSRCGYKS